MTLSTVKSGQLLSAPTAPRDCQGSSSGPSHACQDTLLLACTQKENTPSYESNKHITRVYVGYETPLKLILHGCSNRKYKLKALEATGKYVTSMPTRKPMRFPVSQVK